MTSISSAPRNHLGYGRTPDPKPLPPLVPPSSKPTRSIPSIPARPPNLPYDSPFGTVDGLRDWRVETLCFQAAKPRRLAKSVKLKSDEGSFDCRSMDKVGKEDATRFSEDVRSRIRQAIKDSEVRDSEGGDMMEARSRQADEQETLFVAVNRYFREGGNREGHDREGLTLVLTHGASFCKELWEPVVARILAGQDGKTQLPRIQEVWSLDSVTHGDSAILNAGYFGPLVGDYQDHSNDILQFLLYYLPHSIGHSYLSSSRIDFSSTQKDFTPTLLPLVSVSSAKTPSRRPRNVVLMGHSMGAACLISTFTTLLSPTRLSSTCPSISTPPFNVHSFMLVDPATEHPYRERLTGFETEGDKRGRVGADDWIFLKQAARRKGRWGTRDEARSGLERLFSRWDPDVRERYLELGLRESPDGAFELKCTPRLEASAYSHQAFHSWQSLSLIPSTPTTSPPVTFIFPNPGAMIIFPDEMGDFLQSVAEPLRSGVVEIKRYEREGHLLLYDKPDLVAQEFQRLVSRPKQEVEIMAKL